MKFKIDDLTVYFPYSYIYPEQYHYMCKLKQSLDVKGPVVLEMPSGTGKTVSLLSLITSYQLAHPEVGKLIYCSRTVAEIEKVLEEARRVFSYRDKELGNAAPDILCVGLTSRRNLCIHPRVSEEKTATIVDAKCRNITASWVREQRKADSSIEVCNFFEGFETTGKEALLSGVYSIEDLRDYGKKKGWCPYFLARHLVNFSNVLVFSYQYVIDPKISQLIAGEFKENSIVVFDEAHNIDNACIDALSVYITRQTLEASVRNVVKLTNVIEDLKKTDVERLRREYQALVNGLAQNAVVNVATDDIRADPVLDDDALKEVVPGNIRRGENFVDLMKKFIDHLKGRLRIYQALQETPLSFLQNLYQETTIEARSLRFFAPRLNSLLRNLELGDLDQYSPISIVADFATLVGTYAKGFVLVLDIDERYNEPFLQFCCLDASLAIKPVFTKFRSVVITSGTLSPLDMYPRILNFKPVIVERFPMTLTRNCVCPLLISKGSDQTPLSSKFDLRNDPAVIRNFGNLLVEMSATVPDGIVCFFTSYTYMEEIVSNWNEMGILNQVLTHKLLFVETPDPAETTLALYNYKKACNSGRGAVLFSVARGKVSEGIDFDNQYGRCVILFGIPFVNTESRVLKARLEYLRENFQIQENEFLAFDAMRTASQCVGRVIRGKNDYGLMVFADKRYNRLDKKSKLPKWIADCITAANINLSTDVAASIARQFLKEMSQPFSKDDQLGHSLWSLDHIKQYVDAQNALRQQKIDQFPVPPTLPNTNSSLSPFIPPTQNSSADLNK